MSASMGHDDSGGGLRYIDNSAESELYIKYPASLQVGGTVVIECNDQRREGTFTTKFPNQGPAGAVFTFEGAADAAGASHVEIFDGESGPEPPSETRTTFFNLYYFKAEHTSSEQTLVLQPPALDGTQLASAALNFTAGADEMQLQWTPVMAGLYVGIIKGYTVDAPINLNGQIYTPLDGDATYHIEGADSEELIRSKLRGATLEINYGNTAAQQSIPDEQIRVLRRPPRYIEDPSLNDVWAELWTEVPADFVALIGDNRVRITSLSEPGTGLDLGTYVVCGLAP